MNQVAVAPRAIDFYFDFVSPFGYFASLRIEDLAVRHGRTVNWHSMLIGVSVIKVMGMKPLLEIPLKGIYIRRDALRYARRRSVPLRRSLDEPTVDPLPAGRAYHWLKQHHPTKAVDFARNVFAAHWEHNKDISDITVLSDAALDAGIEDIELGHIIASDSAKQLLRSAVEMSLERGVFGSPFFLVDDEPFFGVEKMELLDEWLGTGGW